MVIFHSHVSLLEGILKIFQRSRSTSILGLNDRVGTVEPPITSLMRMETSRRCTKKGFGPMVPQSLDALFHGEPKKKWMIWGYHGVPLFFLKPPNMHNHIGAIGHKTKQSKHEIKRAGRPQTSPKHWPIKQPKASKTPLVLIPGPHPNRPGASSERSGAEGQVPERIPTGISAPDAFRRERRCLGSTGGRGFTQRERPG